MEHIKLNDSVISGDKTYTLVSVKKCGFEMFGVKVESKGKTELRTFFNDTIARLTMYKLINETK